MDTTYDYAQAGSAKHDYYEMTAGCSFNYLRTPKGAEDRKVAWVQLVNRGPSDHNAPGYGYAQFRCEQ